MPDDMNTGTGTESGRERPRNGGAQAKFRARLEEFERTVRAKVQEVDQSFRDAVRTAVPPDVAEHMKNSKREFLLGIRKFIDREIEKTEREQPPRTPDQQDKQ